MTHRNHTFLGMTQRDAASFYQYSPAQPKSHDFGYDHEFGYEKIGKLHA
jgi:hypothetical protein